MDIIISMCACNVQILVGWVVAVCVTNITPERAFRYKLRASILIRIIMISADMFRPNVLRVSPGGRRFPDAYAVMVVREVGTC